MERGLSCSGLQAPSNLKIPCAHLLILVQILLQSWKKKSRKDALAKRSKAVEVTSQNNDCLVEASTSSTSSLKPPEESTIAVNVSHLGRTMNEKTDVNSYLIEAVLLFKRFRCLFADLILDHFERKDSYSHFKHKSGKDAFKLVAVELGFMYDVLYTKASTIFSGFGIFLRCIYFFSHVSVSVVYLVIIDKHVFSPIDTSITCVLLLGAVFLEVYAIIILLSDWTKLWLTKRNFLSSGIMLNNSRRWSGSMGQYNLLSFCLKDISSKTVRVVQKNFGIKELLEKYQYLTWKDVNVDLQEMIFKHVLENSKKIEGDLFNIKLCKELLAQRGTSCLNVFRWSTIEVEFDHSLLLWHIATDLCYYDDFGQHKDANKRSLACEISKCVSDYMLYLLVICPTMLPKGIGEVRYKDTCAEAMRFFKRKRFGISTEINEVCKALLQVKTDDSLEKIKGDRSLSVLFYGCKAKQLRALGGINICLE